MDFVNKIMRTGNGFNEVIVYTLYSPLQADKGNTVRSK